jgi:hypothetical protein
LLSTSPVLQNDKKVDILNLQFHNKELIDILRRKIETNDESNIDALLLSATAGSDIDAGLTQGLQSTAAPQQRKQTHSASQKQALSANANGSDRAYHSGLKQCLASKHTTSATEPVSGSGVLQSGANARIKARSALPVSMPMLVDAAELALIAQASMKVQKQSKTQLSSAPKRAKRQAGAAGAAGGDGLPGSKLPKKASGHS